MGSNNIVEKYLALQKETYEFIIQNLFDKSIPYEVKIECLAFHEREGTLMKIIKSKYPYYYIPKNSFFGEGVKSISLSDDLKKKLTYEEVLLLSDAKLNL